VISYNVARETLVHVLVTPYLVCNCLVKIIPHGLPVNVDIQSISLKETVLHGPSCCSLLYTKDTWWSSSLL